MLDLGFYGVECAEHGFGRRAGVMRMLKFPETDRTVYCPDHRNVPVALGLFCDLIRIREH